MKREFKKIEKSLNNISGLVNSGKTRLSGRKGKVKAGWNDGFGSGKGSKLFCLMDGSNSQIRKGAEFNTEQYDRIYETPFKGARTDPLSTFSIDVDAASYANTRRFLNDQQLPPKDAVRIEEMINYFAYDYPQPKDKHPFSIITEASECPWNQKHKLVHIGLQGKIIKQENYPPGNLVFLLDVSGSMEYHNKLELLKKSLGLLVSQLRKQDKVAIVVYAGAAGLILPPTSGLYKQKILDALNRLNAGGSTAGGAGITLAYKVAMDNYLKQGNNRVILATDGDFNVGVSSESALVRLIEEKRKSGIYLTVLGFGTGNYKDSQMEKLADKGNGNYAYIDNIREAKKVLGNELGGTLVTIAKDVKIQVEFNPAKVNAYRLIGYENRTLAAQDFNDDTKDAGELGSGHTVTALYEVVPKGVSITIPGIDSLKYQKPGTPNAQKSNDLFTIKFRYKMPTDSVSRLIVKVLNDKHPTSKKSSGNYRFSAAVASFGMLLRDSKYKGESDYDQVLAMAKGAKGPDEKGYRAEFIRMVETAQLLAGK
ncbi:MAG: VWA domain-containing protein [Fibrobacteria bacterium]|nr:VWA domain-containing protein [Fibrobacteria bacterium]